MGHNTAVFLDKLTCNDCVDIAKCPDSFGQFSSSKNDSYYLDVELKVLKRNDNRDFRLVQKAHNGRGSLQPVHAIDESRGHCTRRFWRRVKIVPCADTKKPKDMDEQLKLAHKVVDVVHCPYRKVRAAQCGPAREFICSSPIFCNEEGGREISTTCVCEMYTWISYLSTCCNDFCIWQSYY